MSEFTYRLVLRKILPGPVKKKPLCRFYDLYLNSSPAFEPNQVFKAECSQFLHTPLELSIEQKELFIL